MAHKPPFTLDKTKGTPIAVKRTGEGCATGNVLDKGKAPAGELHVTYRELFQYQYIFEIRSETPYWPEGATTGLGIDAPSGHLAAGQQLIQIDENKTAGRAVTVNRRRVAMCLGKNEGLAKKIWIPTNRLPEPKRGWKTPRLLWPSRQCGIKGDMVFRKDPLGACTDEKKYGMVTVWERWTNTDAKDRRGKVIAKGPRWTTGMMTVRPGTYAGYVQTMGAKADSAEKRKNYPSIWVIWQWDETQKDWIYKVPSAKNENYRVTGVFIHPGPWPTYFLGCMSPGPADKRAYWGFKTFNDTRDALWEIFQSVGVTQKDYVTNKKYVGVSKKETVWFLIRVEDPKNVCAIT
jgi:hypothetical protein